MAAWNFCDVQWGQDEAKGDDDLRDYFVPFPEFDSVKKGECRYVIGRKGTGKTAVIEKIRQEAEDNPLCFYSTLTLRDFPVHDLKDLRDKSYRDKSQYVPAWLFLIYVELAKLIVEDNGAEPRDVVEEINDFLVTNGLSDSIGFAETVTILKKTESKVKVLAKWLEGEKAKSSSVQTEVVVHYNKVVGVLFEKIAKVISESEYWLFMDELDEGYRSGDQSLRLILLALLRAVEDSALAMKSKGLKYRPLLVLRSDIFDRLEDNDLNKLDDFVIRLKWFSKEDAGEYYLKNIPSARIKSSLRVGSADPWSSVVDDGDKNLPPRVLSIWHYMANRTYERPRDIIKFLKYCKKQNKGGLLSFDDVKNAESKYSDWLYHEIRDEIHSYLPCWREALQCLTRIGSGKLKLSDFVQKLNEDRGVSKWMSDENHTPEEIVEILFDFGVIGNLDGKRWLFKYKDDDLAWNPDMDLIVHFGLNKKLRLSR